jgi:hypothetical protein
MALTQLTRLSLGVLMGRGDAWQLPDAVAGMAGRLQRLELRSCMAGLGGGVRCLLQLRSLTITPPDDRGAAAGLLSAALADAACLPVRHATMPADRQIN